MEGNKLVWHLIGKKLFALTILDFSETQIKGEHHMECRPYLLKHCKYLLQCKHLQRKNVDQNFYTYCRPKSE